MPNPKLETYKSKKTGVIYDYTDADAQSQLTGIKDGTSIDSFADVETALAGCVDWSSYAVTGAKNVLHVPKGAFPASLNALTFTESRNSGGELLSLTISGTASAETTLTIGELSTDKLGWILNGLNGGSSATYEYFVRYHNSADGYLAEQDFHNGDNILVCPSQHLANLAGITVKIRIKNGCNLTTPLVIKPMVRQASDSDPTFAPYAMTNRELTDAVTVEDITSDFVTLGENISFGESYSVYKIGKLIICHLVLKRTGNFPEGDYNAIATINSKYLPKKDINGICNWAYTEWSGVITPGYLWLANNTGYINLKQSSATAQTVAKIDICYVSK